MVVFQNMHRSRRAGSTTGLTEVVLNCVNEAAPAAVLVVLHCMLYTGTSFSGTCLATTSGSTPHRRAYSTVACCGRHSTHTHTPTHRRHGESERARREESLRDRNSTNQLPLVLGNHRRVGAAQREEGPLAHVVDGDLAVLPIQQSHRMRAGKEGVPSTLALRLGRVRAQSCAGRQQTKEKRATKNGQHAVHVKQLARSTPTDSPLKKRTDENAGLRARVACTQESGNAKKERASSGSVDCEAVPTGEMEGRGEPRPPAVSCAAHIGTRNMTPPRSSPD